MKKRGKKPAGATAWCALHERLMNDVYIRRRVSLRIWIARLNGWIVAWYTFPTVAGVLLYKQGAACPCRR